MKRLSLSLSLFHILAILLAAAATAGNYAAREPSFVLPDRIEYHDKFHHRVSGKLIDETVSVEILIYEIVKDEQFGEICRLAYSEVQRLIEIKKGTVDLVIGAGRELPLFTSPEVLLVVKVYNKNFTGHKSARPRPSLLSQMRLNRISLIPPAQVNDGKKQNTDKGAVSPPTVLINYTPRIIDHQEDLICSRCHEPVFKKLTEYRYQHVDFVKKHCRNCHIKNYHQTLSTDNFFINGLVEFVPLRMGNVYDATITATDRLYRKETRIIPIEPASIDDFIVNTEIAPEVSDINLLKLDKNIFINIILSWKTDKWSICQIDYGSTGMPYTNTTYQGIYTKDHRIVLHGLPYRDSFNIRVTAFDLFGNKSTPRNFHFLTDDSFDREKELTTNDPQADISYKLLRVYPYTVEWPDSDPGKPRPEIIKIAQKQLITERPSVADKNTRVVLLFSTDNAIKLDIEYTKTVSPDDMHEPPELKNIMESGFLQCLECHPRDISHPVLFKDARIPKEFPAAGGKIMVCATCHQPHGGNSPKFVRFDSTKKVCGRCHKEI